MKRKFKRASKSMLSVILAILIVMSTMLIGTLSVNAAATDGKFDAGDTIYFDFSQNSTEVANTLTAEYATNEWNSSLPSNKIVTVVLKKSIDISQYTGRLYNIDSNGWKDVTNDTTIVPSNGQNMVIVDADGNYTWGTYGVTPTPPGNTNYYIEGRFRVKNTSGTNAALLEWASDSTSIPFNATENDGIYKIETNCTLSDLSENIYCPNGNYTASQYFYVWEQNSNQYYSASNLKMQNCLGSGNAASMSSCTFDSNANWMHFSGTNSAVSSDAKITLYLDTNNGMNLYYTTDEVSEPHNVTIKSNIKVTATAEGANPVVLNPGGDSQTENSINVVASTLTLTAGAADYNFAGWKLGEGASIMSGSVTSPTITVKVTADTTITATAITLTPRLSVNSSVAKNTTAKVKPGEQFTLNALSKVGDKTQKATKYTVDFYKYTDNIDNAQHIGEQTTITNIDYSYLDAYLDVNGKADPPDGQYLIGDKHPAVLTWTETDPGTYHYYADIKGYDDAGNLTTGEYADVSLGTSRLKDDVVVTVAEPLNKANAYESGLWVDVQPSVTDSKIALIKWTNKSGANDNSGNTYTLYVPGGIKLNEMPIYSKITNLKINGTAVAQGGTYNFTHDGSYNVTGDGVNYTLKVYQSTSDSMFTTTTLKNPADSGKAKDGDNLPTQAYGDGAVVDKVEYNGHFMSITASDGAICDDVDMEKIKGRGNSSWKASGEVYGKYAYNVKFTDKIKPLKMKEATKAKSWCLLANNMDPSLLRNISIYQTAKLAGLSNVPEYKVADFYNNGEYLGSYLITEKVDVGGSKLVDGETPEDYYDGSGDGAKHIATYTYAGQSYQYQYVNTGNLNINPTTNEKYRPEDFSYLIEFDLEDRAKAEHCWFQTPQGQYIAFKAPEDINKNEMLFVINKWIEAENAVYTNNYTKMNELMNLDSFADVYLVQEFTKNLDSCATSYFVYWDGTTSKTTDASDVKWEATPIWDYDWALGGYNKEKSLRENPGTDASNKPNDKDGWYAKYKCVTRRDVYENGKYPDIDTKTYNLQAQLANNSDFWNKNVVNAWNSDFYDSITSVYSDKGYLKSAYDDNYNSFDMNEKRYGFINSNPTNVWGTVSLDEGKRTPQGAYEYLLDWTTARAKWMNDRLGETVEVSLDSDSTEIQTGKSVTLTAKLSRDKSDYPMTYQYYMSTDGVNYTPIGEATTDTSLTTDALTAAGTYRFKVCAMYSTYTKATSPVKTVEVKGESAKLTGVSLSTSSSAVAGTQITLNATPATEGTVTGIIYSYYMSKDNAASADDTAIKTGTNLASCTATVPETAGTYYYYVTATFGETTVTSALVHIEVTEQQVGTHNVTFKFKAPSTSPYTPTITLDGKSYTMELTDECLGSIYTGSLKIYWYSVDILVDSTKDNTIRITTRTTDLNAVYTDKFNGSEYYLAVDNLVNGTEVVDLTAQPEHIRNYYHTPLHMVHSDDISDGSLGFTFVDGKRYRMGSYLVNGIATFSIDSVTAIQKLAADSIDVSELQNSLFDCNLDGVVDINDATLMQKALAQ